MYISVLSKCNAPVRFFLDRNFVQWGGGGIQMIKNLEPALFTLFANSFLGGLTLTCRQSA